MSVVKQEVPQETRANATNLSVFFLFGLFALLASFVASGIGFAARVSAIAEISTHFLVWYAVASIASAVLFVIGRHARWAIVSLVVFAWQASSIVPWYFPVNESGAGPSVKMLSANVNADNEHYDRLLSLIEKEKPAIVFIQELSPGWAAAFELLQTDYPHKVVTARTDYFGLGLYSRYPLENVQTEDPINSDVPIIRADAIVDGRRVHLVNVHLAPPEGRELTRMRYRQFAWMNTYVASIKFPFIAAGDYNCAMWSPLYIDLVRAGKLANARKGHGILSSWFPIAGSFHLIPIDQILGGGGVGFKGTRLGTPIGSDHCPLVTEFQLPE